MYLQLNQANNIHEVLLKFSEQKLPIKLSYKIMKIMSSLEREIDFYRNKLANLIQEYGLKDEEGNLVYSEDKENIKLKDGVSEEFYEKYTELMNLEVEIEDFYFSLQELEKLELTPKELYILRDFIDDEDEE